MIARFFRSFLWSVLLASVLSWLWISHVSASSREAILVEDYYKGMDSDIIGPGSSRFLPRRAFPGKVMLHRVIIGARALPINFKVGLRQSDALGLDDSFYINISLVLNFELKSDYLLTLYDKLDKRNWTRLDPYLKKRLNHFMILKLKEFYSRDTEIAFLEDRFRTYLNGEFIRELNEKFKNDGIVFKNVLVEKIYIPDVALYRAMVADSRKIIAGKAANIQKIASARAKRAAERIIDQAYFIRLEKIGRLLVKYPQLRGYLAIDRLNKNVNVIVMPYDKWMGPDRKVSGIMNLLKNRKKSFINSNRGRTPKRNEFVDLTPP